MRVDAAVAAAVLRAVISLGRELGHPVLSSPRKTSEPSTRPSCLRRDRLARAPCGALRRTSTLKTRDFRRLEHAPSLESLLHFAWLGEAVSGDAELELVVHEALTSLTAPAFCRAVRESLATSPAHLWVNLEDVKATDITGPAALLQAVRLCDTRRVSVSILPSPTIYRALLATDVLAELPLEGPGAGPSTPVRVVLREEAAQPPPFLARTARPGLPPPAWEGLQPVQAWAHGPRSDQLMGRQLLSFCRHLGPYHPDFVARALHDPSALTLVV